MRSVTEYLMLAAIGTGLVWAVWRRLWLSQKTSTPVPVERGWAVSQTTGNKEIQSDCIQVFQNGAGIMAVLADGIGKDNTGKVAAQIAVDAVLDTFEPYRVLNNPDYLFRSALLEAHSRIQNTIGERRGGASVGVVFTNGSYLHYALVGNIQIALLRNGELIPISKGQTLSVLAKEAYQEGLLTKNETIWSQNENRIWNYLGKDGFREVEIGDTPVAVKPGDLIMMASQGVFETLSWAETEEILLADLPLKEKAGQMIRDIEKKEEQDKENGSVLLLAAEV